MSKTESSLVSFDAMNFGSENDLRIALTELKWIKKTEGKLTDHDFETVSQKYKFPISFLKKGLSGFSYPEDFMVSKSKWFPIHYSWRVVEKGLSLSLYKLQFDYLRTKFWSIIFLFALGSVLAQFGYMVQFFYELEWLQLLSLIVVPFVFFFTSTTYEVRNTIANKKMKLDEYSAHLEETGFHWIIASNERFIAGNFKMIAYAGNIVLRKLRVAPPEALFCLFWVKPEKKVPQPNRLLVKLHLIPKRPTSAEKENIPVFYGENVYIEYKKRIEELEKSQK